MVLIAGVISALCFACGGSSDVADARSGSEFSDSIAATDIEVVDTDGDGMSDSETRSNECDGRAPLIVDDVLVDPCGCCKLDHNYCSGVASGGSPNQFGYCSIVHDAVPPCDLGIDENGCPWISCHGSCIGSPADH